MKSKNKLIVHIHMDVTGSMAPCFIQVRKNVTQIATGLLEDIPGLELGISASKDYCDDHEGSYLYRELPATRDVNRLRSFMEGLSVGGGGDLNEAYEYVLHRATKLPWKSAEERIFVLIADDEPHAKSYSGNKLKLDWREQTKKLKELGVKVYTAQCLGISRATYFYREVPKLTGGLHVVLDQLKHIDLVIRGIAYSAAGSEGFTRFEERVRKDHKGVFTYGIAHIFETLGGRKTRDVSKSFDLPGELAGFDIQPVPMGRFQAFDVEGEPAIKEFVEDRGIKFKKGRGFYPHVSRTETIQGYKELVLQDLRTGLFFTGSGVRELLGFGDESRRVPPDPLDNFKLWVQSTSVNRKLREPEFMYEVPDDE